MLLSGKSNMGLFSIEQDDKPVPDHFLAPAHLRGDSKFQYLVHLSRQTKRDAILPPTATFCLAFGN